MLEDALRRAEQAKADHRLTVTTAVDTVTVSLRTGGLEGAQSPVFELSQAQVDR
jgi:hypothetical protein